MIKQNLYLGHEFRCELYWRENVSKWYIKYVLPNKKLVRRPCHKSKREANKILRLKEMQLLQGFFDSKDLELMPIEDSLIKQQKRYTFDEGLELYLNTTRASRNQDSQYNLKKTLGLLFLWFQNQGKSFIDNVTHIDVQELINSMDEEGKSESTLDAYVRRLNSLYIWFIDDAEILSMKNPVRKIKIPKKGSKARLRIPNDDEIKSLLSVKVDGHSRLWSPIKNIVLFLAYTGCRLREALHAEWSDFDLEQGVWHIRIKPNTPKKDGLGWKPKWNKERDVLLFPEALELLNALPRLESIGNVPVRNANGKIVGHKAYPANFIFTKREVTFLPNCPMQLERGYFKCCKCDKVGDVDKCLYREYTYSRIDDVSKSWKRLKSLAGVDNTLQLKDLRTYFNSLLRSHYGLSSVEAGRLIGNSEEVNNKHYTSVIDSVLFAKMQQKSLSEVMGINSHDAIN